MMQTGLTRTQKRAQTQLDNDARAVIEHAPTMRFICRILDECRYFDDPFAGNSNTTFRNLGEQEGARKIVRALQGVDPTALQKLLTTASAAQRRDQSASPDVTDEGDSDEH